MSASTKDSPICIRKCALTYLFQVTEKLWMTAEEAEVWGCSIDMKESILRNGAISKVVLHLGGLPCETEVESGEGVVAATCDGAPQAWASFGFRSRSVPLFL